MLKLFLALRYLRKKRIAMFATVAVMLCVGLLIVTTSLFSGFVNAFDGYCKRRFGQVMLLPGKPIAQYEQLSRYLEKLRCVSHATAIIESGGLLYLGKGNIRGVQLVGIDLKDYLSNRAFRNGLLLANHHSFELSPQQKLAARRWLRKRLHRSISDNQLPTGAILGIGLMGHTNSSTDKYDKKQIIAHLKNNRSAMTIITARSNTGISDDTTDALKAPQKIQKPCWPVNVVQTGFYDSDSMNVYLPFDYLKKLIGNRGADGKYRCMAHIKIIGAPGFSDREIITQLGKAWKQFALNKLHWRQSDLDMVRILRPDQMYNIKMLSHEIRKQMVIMQIIMALIAVVAALLVFVILLMMVRQNRRDIGIIRATGASRSSIACIFLGFGAGIGISGAVLGFALGVWATRNINIIEAALSDLLGFKIWRSGVYMFSHIPNTVNWQSIWWIMSLGIISALLGALIPAVKAAWLQPVQALRYE